MVSTTSVGSISTCRGPSSFITATVMVDVWTRPLRSVGGVLCQRWPPASGRKVSYASGPITSASKMPGRASRTRKLKTPPNTKSFVDFGLLFHQELCVFSAFCRTNFDDDFHLFSFSFERRARSDQPIRSAYLNPLTKPSGNF